MSRGVHVDFQNDRTTTRSRIQVFRREISLRWNRRQRPNAKWMAKNQLRQFSTVLSEIDTDLSKACH